MISKGWLYFKESVAFFGVRARLRFMRLFMLYLPLWSPAIRSPASDVP